MLGYLKYHEQTARYRLAASVLSFGYPLLCQLGVRQIARAHMQELADFARGAVSLAMRGGDHMVLIESCVDKNAPSGRPDVGATRQFADTSLGHTYYSATNDTERKEIDAVLKARDPQAWPALRKQLAASHKSFQAKGFCIVSSPGAGLMAISVPLGFIADDELLIMNCAVAQSKFDIIDHDRLTTLNIGDNDDENPFFSPSIQARSFNFWICRIHICAKRCRQLSD
jgi:DNA-binding IclR family transcriptional regulator